MTALEFVKDIAGMMGWEKPTTLVSPSKEIELILQATNDVFGHIQDDKRWPELTLSAHLLLEGVSTWDDCTVNASYGSSTLSATGASFVAGDVGKKVFVSGTKVQYVITAVGSSTSVTLDRPWSEADLSAATRDVHVGQDTYELPADFDRFYVDKLYLPAEDTHVQVVGKDELNVERQLNGLQLSSGIPQKCTIHGLSTDGTKRKIHFDLCAKENYELEFDYQRKHPTIAADADTVYYPSKNMLYIKDMVKARLDRDAEMSPLAQQIFAEAQQSRGDKLSSHDSGAEPMRIRPEVRPMGRYRRNRRG